MKTIAMTLGPIVETLSMGRKTSEIWAASYFFSSLMRRTIQKIKEQDRDADFLVPYVEDESLFRQPDGGIGKFHDRLIFKTGSMKLEDLDSIVDSILREDAKMMAEAIEARDKKAPTSEEFHRFLRSYIQPYLIEIESEDIERIYRALDELELHTPLPEGENLLKRFLRRDVILNSVMAKEAFGTKPSFDSIPSIAAQEKDLDEIDEKGKMHAQRYIAIVHADGDNLGQALKGAGSPRELSKRLFDFGKASAEILSDYGCETLFIGGDDLLFFAPVIKEDGETIFDLIDQLSEVYTKSMASDATLSFGVSVTYYKYPLYEALEISRKALFDLAKKHPGKNAIGMQIQKHSGQSFRFALSKSERVYKLYKELLAGNLDGSMELPHSVHHKLKKLQPLIGKLPVDKQRIEALFENFFNEEIHQTRFKSSLQLLEELFVENGQDQMGQEKLFAMLSAIKLLRGDR